MANTVNFFSSDPASLIQQQMQQQRLQRMADALQQQSMEPLQSYGQMSPISWTQVLGKVLQGAVAAKGQAKAGELASQIANSQNDQFNRLVAGSSTGYASGVNPPEMLRSPEDLANPPPAQPAYTGGGIPSLTGDPGRDIAFARSMGLDKYAEAAAARFKPTDQELNDTRVGITAPIRRGMEVAGAYKQAINPNSTTVTDVDANGNPFAREVSGLLQNMGNVAATTTAASEAQKPHFTDDPFHPGRVITTFATPPALASAPTGIGAGRAGGSSTGIGGGGNTAADLEGQKVGAKNGIEYAQKLSDDAEAAVNGKRTLAEMGNLLQGFTPGSFAPVLSNVGALAQSLGVNPATVEKYTNMRPGDAQAFQKGTAALATEAAKQVSNRVTQMEFKTFLANNPNWMMQPDGIKRVMDFMDKGFDSAIDKQAEFANWSQSRSPDKWSTGFSSYYNAKKVGDIRAGKTNSAPAQFTPYQTLKDVKKENAGVNLPTVMDKSGFDKLAKGAAFIGPDGMIYHKP